MFWIELLVGKSILPIFGGSPQVWPTCLLFFQTALLAGYALAHFLTRYRWGGAAGVYIVLWIVAIRMNLPFRLHVMKDAVISQNPIGSLLTSLWFSIGPLFILLAATSTLVQNSLHSVDSKVNPYLLYQGSNAGSLLGLIAFPFIIEPLLGLKLQIHTWQFSILVLMVLLISIHWEGAKKSKRFLVSIHNDDSPIKIRNTFLWVIYAAIPSALMCAVTTYITLDLVPMPLVWVLSLGVYLLTMIFAFSEKHAILMRVIERVIPSALMLTTMMVTLRGNVYLLPMLVLHLVGLFTIGFYFHRNLYQTRPPSQHLSIFYFNISLGGVLGSAFSGWIAPTGFSDLWEYPIILIVAAFFWKGRIDLKKITAKNALCRLLFIFMLLFSMKQMLSSSKTGQTSEIVWILRILLPLLVYSLMAKPRFFALALIGIVLGYGPSSRGLIYQSRSFFGTHKVVNKLEEGLRVYMHGSTIHGAQVLADKNRMLPTTYFHIDGPVGDLMTMIHVAPGPKRVGVIGLGVGTLAAYEQKGDRWVFYEVDRQVRFVAESSGYFSFLKNDTGFYEIKMGDGRQSLEIEKNQNFDCLLIDAFSSDSVPIHLITREAVALYFLKLKSKGLLIAHISNRYLDFGPVLARHGLFFNREVLIKNDFQIPLELRDIRFPSSWAVFLPQHDAEEKSFLMSRGWREAALNSRVQDWTDDYSNLAMIYNLGATHSTLK